MVLLGRRSRLVPLPHFLEGLSNGVRSRFVTFLRGECGLSLPFPARRLARPSFDVQYTLFPLFLQDGRKRRVV